MEYMWRGNNNEMRAVWSDNRCVDNEMGGVR